MSKDVNLGKVWLAAADDAARGVGVAFEWGARMLNDLTSNPCAESQKMVDEFTAEVDAVIAARRKKERRLTILKKQITATNLNKIPGRPKTRFLGLVTCASDIKDEIEASLDFYERVVELGGDAVIGLRVRRSRGGYIHIEGNVLAPVGNRRESARRD